MDTGVHVRGPGMPPSSAPGGGGLARPFRLHSKCNQFPIARLRLLPLFPQYLAQASPDPLIQQRERVLYRG